MEKFNLNDKIFTNTTRILSSTVIIIGLVVIIGWLLDLDSLKSIIPTWVTMKFSTAVSFLMSGIVVMLLNEWRNNNSEFSRIFLFAPLIIISFFMTTLLVTTILDTTSGVSSLFVKDDPGAIGTLIAGLPSLGTMINFLLIIIVGFTALLVGKFSERKFKKFAIVSGGLVLVLGIIALIGYATEESALYYQIEEYSGAMAIHTAIAFCLIGIGIMFFVKPKIQTKEITKQKFTLPISIKLIFYFLIAAIIPMGAVGGISFDLAQTSLEQETFESLNEQSDINLDRLEGIFFERKADAEVTSKIKLLSEEIPTLTKYLNDKTNQEFIDSRDKLDQRLIPIEQAYGYDSILLTDENGTFVYVTHEKADFLVGTPLQNLDASVYDQGKKRVYISHIIDDIGGDGLPELFPIIQLH